MKLIPISEIFMGLQGEGRYTGHPAVFVRVSGCTRHCSYCDSSFHRQPIAKLSPEDILAEIKKCGKDLKDYRVVLTGGEPLLSKEALFDFTDCLASEGVDQIDLETNGDLIKTYNDWYELYWYFAYIAISPKVYEVGRRVAKLFERTDSKRYDIKIVTDGKMLGMDMLRFATMLMPLTTKNEKENKLIRQRVWNQCIQHGLIFSGRQHVEVWGPKMRRV